MNEYNALDLIAKLREVKEGRGASQAEALAAQRRIGSLLQDLPSIHLTITANGNTREKSSTPPPKDKPSGYSRNKDTFLLGECLYLRSTAKALLLNVDGEETWIPKGQCLSSFHEWSVGDLVLVTVTYWFATQRGWTN